MTNKTRVFSGIRPSGQLHLGNYFGAIKGCLELQERKDLDCIYGVVDLHGITSPYDPSNYPQLVQDLVLDYLACGLNPKKAHLIIQSHLPQHLELAYYLGTIYPVSRLEQLPTYKEKNWSSLIILISAFFLIPFLMAADILIYQASLVPVGKDQLPHLELTREVARIFNRRFGAFFPEPQAYLTPGSYVPSLTGKGKMSKTNEQSYISLRDDFNTIQKKLAKVPTDSGHGTTLPQEGGVQSLLILVELFLGAKQRQKYEKQYLTGGLKYQDLKQNLAQAIFQYLQPIQEKKKLLMKNDQNLVKAILKEGEN